jgi:hypothetical protein
MADGFVPPQAVRANAKRGLELRQKYNRGGTQVGVARARDLSNGASLSLSTIKRMNSYFARHEVDKKGEGWGKDSAGYIAWLLWGGDAGWSWVKGILKDQDKKDKSMNTDFAYAYAELIKADKNADGTMTVYGKATDDSLDMDMQICDPAWLDTAMPQWFKSGGNIREMHTSIAAGVAKEYEAKNDGHYITALVVDPLSVKKVENGVLRGFSIGIKSPRVVRDQKAANGRIIDGQIIEVSLVDRPANPNAKLIMAKSVEGESSLVQVEEFHEYKAPLPSELFKAKEPDYENMIKPRKGEPADKELYARVIAAAKKKFKVYPSAVANAWVVQEYKRRGGTYSNSEKREFTSQQREDMAQEGTAMPDGSYPIANKKDLQNAIQAFGRAKNPAKVKQHIIRRARALGATDLLPEKWKESMSKAEKVIERAKSVGADLSKFDQATFDAARTAIAELFIVEAKELAEGEDERESLDHLLDALDGLMDWYENEIDEGEVSGMDANMIELSAEADTTMAMHKEAGCADCDCKGCNDCEGCDGKYCKMCKCGMGADSDMEKSVNKCLECGCHQPATTHGLETVAIPSGLNPNPMVTPANVSTAQIVTPEQGAGSVKSAEADKVTEVAEIPATEEVSEVESSESTIDEVVEKAVKSAMESVKAEIDALRADKEAAVEKSVKLESELATALTKAVAGGPKRTATIQSSQSNEYLIKASTYKAKADATTDAVLRKGYMALYAEFSAKAGTPVEEAE